MRCLPSIVRVLVALVVSVALAQPPLAAAAACGARDTEQALLATPAASQAHDHEDAAAATRGDETATASVSCPTCDCAAMCVATTLPAANTGSTGLVGLAHALIAAHSPDLSGRSVAPEIHPPIA